MGIYYAIGSPDNDGNGSVDIADFTRFQAAFLSDETCNEFYDCFEFVNMSDFTVFQEKFGVGCP